MKSLLIAILILLHQPTEVPYKQLTFADFKGKGEGAGYTTTGIDLHEEHIDGRYRIFVSCYFVPEESWLNLRTAEVLLHEQKHFDITRAFANRMEEILPQFQGCDSLTYMTVKAYYDHLITEWHNEQSEYDDTSKHGTDTAQQTRWNNLIAEQLKQSK